MLKASTFLLSKEKGENWGKTQPTKKADIAKAKILHHSYNSASHKWDYFDTTCNIWQRAFYRHRLEFIRVETAGSYQEKPKCENKPCHGPSKRAPNLEIAGCQNLIIIVGSWKWSLIDAVGYLVKCSALQSRLVRQWMQQCKHYFLFG